MSVAVAVQQERRALWCVAVLVQVGGEAGDAVDSKIPGRQTIPPRQCETAEAGVDVEGEIARPGDLGDLGDRIEHSRRVVGCRGHDENRVVPNGIGDVVGAHRSRCRRHGHPDRLDTEQFGGLEECRVCGRRQDHRRLPGCSAHAIAGSLHGEQAALGATRGDRPHGVRTMKSGAAELDQIAFHRCHGAEHRRVESVDRLHHSCGRRRDLVEHLESGVVDVRQHMSAVRRRIRRSIVSQFVQSRVGSILQVRRFLSSWIHRVGCVGAGGHRHRSFRVTEWGAPSCWGERSERRRRRRRGSRGGTAD